MKKPTAKWPLITTRKLAQVSARHPWRTIAGWLTLVVLAIAASGAFLGSSLTAEDGAGMTNDPESLRAKALIDERLPQRPQVDEVVIVRSAARRADDPRFRGLVARLRAELAGSGAVATVGDPYARRMGTEGLISKDGHAVMLPLVMGPDPSQGIGRVIGVVQRADRRSGAQVRITGTWSASRDFMTVSQRDLRRGELGFGLPAALLVLAIVFGSLGAAFVPIALAFVSIIVAVGLAALLGQLAQLNVFVLNMITAMGLALGIDYTLFVLSRVREERRAGRLTGAAIDIAGATASRAVLFSGTAFVLAMTGLLLVPDATLRSLAAGAILVGSVSVAAALTLLPAILRLAGDRVEALRVPFVGRHLKEGAAGEGRFWSWIAARVIRRPLASGLAATLLLLAAASPLVDMHTGFAGPSTLPDDLVSKQGFVALQRNFGESLTEPVRIAVDGDVSSPRVRADIARLDGLLRSDRAFGPPSTLVDPSRRFALVSVPLAGDSTGSQAYRAVDRLRGDYVPRAFPRQAATVLVGGDTAERADYFALVDHWLPIAIGAVLLMTSVLLTVVFRSLALALQAVAFNLLSVGAAYGLIVLVFVKGLGNELFGFIQVQTVTAWIPLFLFAVLFGLSMDYNVFLLSRIRERFGATGDHTGAIGFGIGSTARLITGAALIIVAVFAGFARSDLVSFQQAGFGVAVALLVDATIVRSVLVPASLQLLGRRSWWLPRWLRWLPRTEGEKNPRSHPRSLLPVPEGGR